MPLNYPRRKVNTRGAPFAVGMIFFAVADLGFYSFRREGVFRVRFAVVDFFLFRPFFHQCVHRLDPAPRVQQAATYMINTCDRKITHNVAKIGVDQILDLIAGLDLNYFIKGENTLQL